MIVRQLLSGDCVGKGVRWARLQGRGVIFEVIDNLNGDASWQDKHIDKLILLQY